jgi:hypothetical protein
MNIPEFTAQASLYRSSNHYQSSFIEFGGSVVAQTVVTALTHEDTVNCSACEGRCNDAYAECVGAATATWAVGLAGCAFTGPFYPACAAAASTAYAIADAVCVGKLAACHAANCDSPGSPCCPVSCEFGHCCSHGETCTPLGCCPSNQVVCGGDCCGVGSKCCGDKCCPSHFYCLDGNFCSEYPNNIPFGNPPPPKNPSDMGTFRQTKRARECPRGSAHCGNECCPPNLQCCALGNGRLGCRDTCLA